MDVATGSARLSSGIWRERLAFAAGLPANTLSSLMLCVVVAGAPLLFGSREPATVAFWVLWLGLAMLFVSPRQARRPHLLLLAGIASLALAYMVVLHEQLSDTPWLATPHPIWADTAKALGQDVRPSASIARNAPYYAAGTIAANMLALAIGVMVGTDRRLARRVLMVAAWAGAAYAAYGIFALFVTPSAILWRDKEAYGGLLTGTFINRNTAASYFGSVAAIWLLVFLETLRERLPPGVIRWRAIWTLLTARIERAMLIPFALFFLCLCALFMTQSRGGVIFSACAFILAFWLYFYRDMIGATKRLLPMGAAILVSLLLLQVLTGAVGHRLETQGLADTGRIVTARATLGMIAERPWFGTGLGTYPWAFPAFRSDDVSMWGIWDMAHSTPLQLAADVGVPLTLLTALAWLVALALLARAIFVRRRDTMIPSAALAVSVIALGHSSIDFSLQVAGYSIVVFGLLGVGLAQSFRSPRLRRG